MVFAGTSRRGHRVIVISLGDLPPEMLEETWEGFGKCTIRGGVQKKAKAKKGKK